MPNKVGASGESFETIPFQSYSHPTQDVQMLDKRKAGIFLVVYSS